jgi:hypothetical protein
MKERCAGLETQGMAHRYVDANIARPNADAIKTGALRPTFSGLGNWLTLMDRRSRREVRQPWGFVGLTRNSRRRRMVKMPSMAMMATAIPVAIRGRPSRFLFSFFLFIEFGIKHTC